MSRTSCRLALFWFTVATGVAGCGGGPPPEELIAPEIAQARQALATALDAWKVGRRESGILIGSRPSVGVVDSTREDRRLLDYEILGPLLVAEKSRPFAVRLSLDDPRENAIVRYLVIGRDPLWVFRQEDFERMLHWEHRMDSSPTTLAAP